MDLRYATGLFFGGRGVVVLRFGVSHLHGVWTRTHVHTIPWVSSAAQRHCYWHVLLLAALSAIHQHPPLSSRGLLQLEIVSLANPAAVDKIKELASATKGKAQISVSVLEPCISEDIALLDALGVETQVWIRPETCARACACVRVRVRARARVRVRVCARVCVRTHCC